MSVDLTIRVTVEHLHEWINLGWRRAAQSWAKEVDIVGGKLALVPVEAPVGTPFPCQICAAPIAELDWIVLKICEYCDGGLL